MLKPEKAEAKSLRWLANQFPCIEDPSDDSDRLCNAIHLYASYGADCIDRLKAEVDALRVLLKSCATVCPVNPDCKCWACIDDCDTCFGGPLCDFNDDSPCFAINGPAREVLNGNKSR